VLFAALKKLTTTTQTTTMSIELVRSFLLKSKSSKRQSFLNDLFKSMDKDHSRKIDYSEFKTGMRNLGLADLTESEIRNLFNEFDSKKDGKIDYKEFVTALNPPLASNRQSVIDRAFQKLDINNDGVLSMEDFRVCYIEQAKKHPKCIDGTWTVEQVTNNPNPIPRPSSTKAVLEFEQKQRNR
jgi:Ca2+-binding EF-hand superfamily protein